MGRRRMIVFAGALAGCAAVTGLDGYAIDESGAPTPAPTPTPSPESGTVIADGSTSGTDGTVVVPPPSDAGADVVTPTDPPPCDVTKPFGPPVKLSTLATGGDEGALHFLPDERTVFFSADRKDGKANDLWTATRTTITDSFTNLTRLTFASSASEEKDPMVTTDGRTMFFTRNDNLWMATRASTSDPFSQTELKSLNTARELSPFYSEVAKVLYFSSNKDGTFRIVRSAYVLGGTPEAPVHAGGLDLTPGDDTTPVLSPDGLTIYFASARPGGKGKTDLWRATRDSLIAPWANSTILSELSSASEDYVSWISPDDCRIYFHSNREGSFHAYVSARQ